jgi:channel protein (hemolysin III family)
MPIAPIPPDVFGGGPGGPGGAGGAIASALHPALIHLHGFWDPFSAASHLVGAAVFLVLGVRLVRRAAPDPARQLAVGVYAACAVLLLLCSGVYHMATGGTMLSRLLVRLDHAAIFFLIAGTFTPIHALLFRGALRWAPLVFIWLAAVVGAILKTLYFYSVPESVGLSLFLLMGWLGLIGGVVLLRREGFTFVRPLLRGGVAFSVGAAMEFARWPVVLPGVIHAHDVFHLAVLAGCALHFSFIWRFAAPTTAPTAADDRLFVPPLAAALMPAPH